MKAKISVFFIHVEVIHLLIYNFNDCTFKCILLLERWDLLKLLEHYSRQSWLRLTDFGTTMTSTLFRFFTNIFSFEDRVYFWWHFFLYSNMLASIRAVTASKLGSNEKPPLLKTIFKSYHLIEIGLHKKFKYFWRYQYKQPRVSKLPAFL